VYQIMQATDSMQSRTPSIEELMATVETLRSQIELILNEAYRRRRGRPPYDPIAMLKGLLYRTRTQSLRQLSRELQSNRRLLGLTGLYKVPSHQTFSNFVTRIGEERLRRISGLVVGELRKYWPDFGEIMSVDGTVVKAYARNNRGIRSTTDPDAAFGYKEHKPSGKPRLEFGYRLTIASDARYEVPIVGVTTPAKANEGPLYPTILKQAKNLGLPLEVVVADGQYDSRMNLWLTIAYGAKPVIHLNPRASKIAKLTGTRKSDAILPIRRNSPEWKRYAAMRSASERVNSALKDHVGLKTLKTRRLPRVAAFFWACVLAKQLFALSAARLGRNDLARSSLAWCY
jgi:transposase